jgi:penicillin-binding protein 1C
MLEPDRQEYFVSGTQMKAIRLVSENTPTIQSAHFISTPTDGTIFAWDPDIPEEKQQLKLEARQLNQHLSSGIYWEINGENKGSSNPWYWPLQKGRFTVSLFSQDGRKLDEIHFQVR